MLEIIGNQLTYKRIPLETLPPDYKVRALRAIGVGEEVARVFGFGAVRNAVIELAKRKKVLA